MIEPDFLTSLAIEAAVVFTLALIGALAIRLIATRLAQHLAPSAESVTTTSEAVVADSVVRAGSVAVPESPGSPTPAHRPARETGGPARTTAATLPSLSADAGKDPACCRPVLSQVHTRTEAE